MDRPTDDQMCEVGRALRAARIEAGCTQADAAAAVGVTQAAVALVEGGEHLPSVPLLAALCTAYGVTTDSVLWPLLEHYRTA